MRIDSRENQNLKPPTFQNPSSGTTMASPLMLVTISYILYCFILMLSLGDHGQRVWLIILHTSLPRWWDRINLLSLSHSLSPSLSHEKKTALVSPVYFCQKGTKQFIQLMTLFKFICLITNFLFKLLWWNYFLYICLIFRLAPRVW